MMKVEMKSCHGTRYKREFPTFARGVRTGAIYFMISEREGVVVKAAPSAPYGYKHKAAYYDDCFDFLAPGTKIEIIV